MALFLPQPQEIEYLSEELEANRCSVCFVSPWNGDDALLECLGPGLNSFCGREVPVQNKDLPGEPGCTLAIAPDFDSARQLAAAAVEMMRTPVKTLTICLDGGNMSEPTDGMGKPEAPAEGIERLAEAYTLLMTKQGIAIAGSDRAGLFYGVQTLLQALEDCAGKCRGMRIRDFPSQRIRGIHFDMKYDFYRVETIMDHLRQMAALKLNVALFEYEDKFPYRRHPVIVDHERAMSRDDIETLKKTAARHHIRIIPLVQTLGHLEFVLKHKEIAHLREIPDGTQMICPKKPEAQKFVRDLIDELLEAHPEADFLHIGADETYLLGRCPVCKAEAPDEAGRVRLWVDHYTALCRYVLERGVRPILWDDILRGDAAQAARLPREAVICYWIYETVRERHGQRRIPPSLEQHYACAGKRPAELPDTLSMYPYFDYYRSLGFDVIAAPCFNVGTLVPVFEVTTRNTATWAEKTCLCDGLGMINTAWACYMMHPDSGWYGIGQTADVSWRWPSINRLDLDSRFGKVLFGLPTPEIAECLAALSVGVGFPSKLKRPLSILNFSYMDNVIHFEGNLEARSKLGQLMWSDYDVYNFLLRKLELIEEAGLRGEIERQLDYVEPIIESALQRLRALEGRVRRRREVITFLVAVGELKAMRCRHWRFFLDQFARRAEPPTPEARAAAAQMLAEEDYLRARYESLTAAKICPQDTRIVISRLFDGERRFLADLAAGARIPRSYRTSFATNGK